MWTAVLFCCTTAAALAGGPLPQQLLPPATRALLPLLPARRAPALSSELPWPTCAHPREMPNTVPCLPQPLSSPLCRCPPPARACGPSSGCHRWRTRTALGRRLERCAVLDGPQHGQRHVRCLRMSTGSAAFAAC